jgi:hypothetical protein
LEAVVEQQDVPKEEAAVKTIRALENRYGDWHLAVGSRRQLKKWIQGDGGSWQELATAQRRLTSIAIPAQRKGHSCQGPCKDDDVSRTPKGLTFDKIRREWPKWKDGIRGQGLNRQLLLGSKRAFNKTIRQTFRLEVMKRAVRIFIWLQEMSDWTLWMGSAASERKKRCQKWNLRSRLMVVQLGRLAPYQGTTQDEQP